MMMRFTLLFSSPVLTAAAAGDWTAHRLPEAAKAPQNARCLDGSPPLYYHSPATSEAAKDKWEIHMEGGAWCSDALSCTNWWGFRSTDVDPDVEPADWQAVTGYLNRSLETNPMRDWNYVFIRYCDGFSFVGGLDQPEVVQVTNVTTKKVTNVTVWLRGRAILDAVIDDLLSDSGPGMHSATDVVIGGCSAGGMAVYLNCDHWATRIAATNTGTHVVCLADAGWFPLIDSTFSNTWFNGVFHNSYISRNASASMHPKCLADTNSSTQWQCAMPQVAARYVETPLFAYQARYDAYQIPNMLQDCFGNSTDKFGGRNCSSSMFTAWGSMVADHMTAWLATPHAKATGHAAFISSCYFHCGSHPTWGVVLDGRSGMTGAEAFGQWMADPPAAESHVWNDAAVWNATSEAICTPLNVPGWEKRGVVPQHWRVPGAL